MQIRDGNAQNVLKVVTTLSNIDDYSGGRILYHYQPIKFSSAVFGFLYSRQSGVLIF